MRLASLARANGAEAAVVVDEHVVPVREILDPNQHPIPDGPVPMLDLVDAWTTVETPLREALADRASELAALDVATPRAGAELAAPLPNPRSLRDFYAFEEHVARSWKRRGEPVPDAWYEIPVFYFSNPAVTYGPGQRVPRPSASQALDFELEVGWVPSRTCSDLDVEEAEDAILGLTVLDDFSARDLQKREMSVGLGPSKGKDFATGQGPVIVTLDELEDERSNKAFDLEMTARVNGEQISHGNLDEIHYSLASMTAYASRDSTIQAGDLMGTGTVGTGSILDQGTEDWLQPGDTIELEVEGIGTLTHRIVEP